MPQQSTPSRGSLQSQAILPMSTDGTRFHHRSDRSVRQSSTSLQVLVEDNCHLRQVVINGLKSILSGGRGESNDSIDFKGFDFGQSSIGDAA